MYVTGVETLTARSLLALNINATVIKQEFT